jgi:hypothetical protein
MEVQSLVLLDQLSTQVESQREEIGDLMKRLKELEYEKSKTSQTVDALALTAKNATEAALRATEFVEKSNDYKPRDKYEEVNSTTNIMVVSRRDLLRESVWRREESNINLSEDSFAFMKTKKDFLRLPWWYSIIIYYIQFLLLVLVLARQFSSWDTPFSVPFRVDISCRIGQFAAIIVTVAIARDVVIPIRELLLLGLNDRQKWCQVVGVSLEQASTLLWVRHILIPNILQFIEGFSVVFVSYVIVIQSDDIIELFNDFAAVQIVAEIDNVAFWLADNGYFGTRLRHDCMDLKRLQILDEDQSYQMGCCRLLLRPFILFSLFLMMIGAFIPTVQGQISGRYFTQKYPNCRIPDGEYHKIGDGVCKGGVFNTFECAFDGGDCIDFNIAYPRCKIIEPSEIGDGICQQKHNRTECGFDGGDCCPLERNDKLLGDGICHSGHYSAAYCNYDNGDCDEMRGNYTFCNFDTYSSVDYNGEPIEIGDGICTFIPEYMNEECGWVFGDCAEKSEIYKKLKDEYPNCEVDLLRIGDGECDGGKYNTEQCNWDGGDCNNNDDTR